MSAHEIFGLCAFLFFAVIAMTLGACVALMLLMALTEKMERYFEKGKRDAK